MLKISTVSYQEKSMDNYNNNGYDNGYNNNDNRVTICYSANYEKALKNGINNIKDIKIVEKCYGLQNFSCNIYRTYAS